MTKTTHLTLRDRNKIQGGLLTRKPFRAIAKEINKHPSTVSREIRAHMQVKRKGAKWSRFFNDCKHRKNCDIKYLCDDLNCLKNCSRCSKCNFICAKYEKEVCPLLEKAPYVCNGCVHRTKCSLEKRYYDSVLANNQYIQVLTETRSGIAIDEAHLQFIDDVVCPLLRKGQSFHHIYETHKDELHVSERTLYKYLKHGLFNIDNLELPRIVRYKKRVNTNHYKLKIDKKCYIGRTHNDYLEYIKDNPDLPVVQMDSVEGIKGGKVLLTIYLVNCSLMLAFIRDRNTARSVTNIINDLYSKLGHEDYTNIFSIALQDRGSEFTQPKAIEKTEDGIDRTRVFFCDPMASWQKASIEVGHSLIRRILPKGTSFNNLSQDKINLMMNHINSYTRKKLGNCTPYEIFEKMYGEEVIKKLGITFIYPDNIILKPSLIK